MSFVELIQVTLAPVVLITAVALINISQYARYGRIHDRIRQLLKDVEKINLAKISEEIRNKKIAVSKDQLRIFLERARLAKWSLVLMQLSLVASAIDAILIFINVAVLVELGFVIIIIFGFSVLLILIGAILAAFEIYKSLKGLHLEIEAVIKS
ncbi:MAG: DUF2721 domain-containing protein [Candidatus Bathyarchaeota archaeon]